MASIAAVTSGWASNPSWATKRAARIIRSGSSPKEMAAATGVRNVWDARSASPPCGSAKSH